MVGIGILFQASYCCSEASGRAYLRGGYIAAQNGGELKFASSMN
jgi:hypothetical protein